MSQSSPEGIILGKGSNLVSLKLSVKETVEEAFNRIFDNKLDRVLKAGFIAGAKWQQEKFAKDIKRKEEEIKLLKVELLHAKALHNYSYEDMSKLWKYVVNGAKEIMLGNKTAIGGFADYMEQFKKKL